MDTFTQDNYTSLKKNIELRFVYLCDDVTQLRSVVFNHTPGNIEFIFAKFRNDFDSVFTMSSNNKKLDKELVKTVNTWLNKNITSLKGSDVRYALDLFNLYKAELFKHEIIKY